MNVDDPLNHPGFTQVFAIGLPAQNQAPRTSHEPTHTPDPLRKKSPKIISHAKPSGVREAALSRDCDGCR
jgi:hypothetical protein